MLILKRRRDQGVQIGADVTVTVVGIEAGAVILGIIAPSTTQITRTIRVYVETVSDGPVSETPSQEQGMDHGR